MYSFIYYQIINNSGDRISQKIKFLFYSSIKKIILKYKDPLIDFTLWGSKMKIPFSYQLPVILKTNLNYNLNLKRIANYIGEKYSSLKIIDVGANIGDTAALLKSEKNSHILCIEGDDNLFEILKLNSQNFVNVELAKHFLSEDEGTLNAKLSTNLGTGSIVESAENKLKTVSLDKLLNEHSNFRKSKLIKIDTDGFDYKIIRGGKSFIEEYKPVIFIEYDPQFHKIYKEDSLFIFEFLEKIGYSKVIFYDNYGDYLISLSINDWEKIKELTNYFSNRNFLKYCDLCFFHKEDEDIFSTTRERELKFFLSNRKN